MCRCGDQICRSEIAESPICRGVTLYSVHTTFVAETVAERSCTLHHRPATPPRAAGCKFSWAPRPASSSNPFFFIPTATVPLPAKKTPNPRPRGLRRPRSLTYGVPIVFPFDHHFLLNRRLPDFHAERHSSCFRCPTSIAAPSIQDPATIYLCHCSPREPSFLGRDPPFEFRSASARRNPSRRASDRLKSQRDIASIPNTPLHSQLQQCPGQREGSDSPTTAAMPADLRVADPASATRLKMEALLPQVLEPELKAS